MKIRSVIRNSVDWTQKQQSLKQQNISFKLKFIIVKNINNIAARHVLKEIDKSNPLNILIWNIIKYFVLASNKQNTENNDQLMSKHNQNKKKKIQK